MAVFCDHKIQSDGVQPASAVYDSLAWHKHFSLLAVASKNEKTDADGCVKFYLDEGKEIESASIQRSVSVQCMQWHPEEKIIAIGWRSGEITVYNNNENEFYEQSSIHREAISFLEWNQQGTRLVSGDQSGLLVVWKVESKGQLHPTPLHQHRLRAALTHSAMHHPGLHSNLLPGTGSVLEAFSWSRKNAPQTVTDPIACFCAAADGSVHYLNNNGECLEKFSMETAIHSLLLDEECKVLVVVTQEMILTQFSISSEGHHTQKITAKLSGKNRASAIAWVAEGALASCSAENVVRVWDFERSENYVLNVHHHTVTNPDEVVTSIDYDSQKGILAAGTNAGNVVLWKRRGRKLYSTIEGAEQWELVAVSMLAGPIVQVQWGSKKGLLAANSKQTVQILSQHVMSAHHNDHVSAVQVSSSSMLLECHASEVVHSIECGMHIKGIFVTKDHVAVWSGKKLAVYAFSQEKAFTRLAGSFPVNTTMAALYENSVYTVDRNQISIRAFQGSVKQVLQCNEDEGSLVALNVCSHFLTAGSSSGHVKVWDISRREAKLINAKCISESIPECGTVVSVMCNCKGSIISVLMEMISKRSQCLVLWDIESDVVKTFNPIALLERKEAYSHITQKSVCLPDLPDAQYEEQLRMLSKFTARHLISHHWDSTEPKLLAIEAANLDGESATVSGKQGEMTGQTWEKLAGGKGRVEEHLPATVVVASVFVTPELNILMSNVVPNDPSFNSLIGMEVPYLFFSQKTIAPTSASSGSIPMLSTTFKDTQTVSVVVKLTLQDFAGLERSDESILQAMVNFSYHCTVGNMEAAFQAIKLIKSEAVWESMARMCVKTQRLDVAAVCLGNMGNARAAKAVREASTIPEAEARLAVLAIHLGMLEEAEELYKRSGRYDLLNKFYQASGKWPQAMEVAVLQDRMHLKPTYYSYAKHAEAIGEYTAAINSYEKSQTHDFEVPRMLLDDPLELENYVMKSKDSVICKWWAEYMESMGELEQAMQFYETAKDHFSLVRILCFNGHFDKAADVVEQSGSKAAAYHLARRLGMDTMEIKRAIYFFTKAQCYSPALQLAKEHGLDNELMNLALLSSYEDKIEAARHYEESDDTVDKAIILYHKAGEISKALNLCFQKQELDILQQISEDLSENTDPATAIRVANYFMEHGQFDKAVDLLVKSRKYEEALDLCMAHSVSITEELAEQMTIQKNSSETKSESNYRVQLLEKLAECCANQQSYHLATKKYTQAGNKIQAMKCLLKSGDTEKIVFFAGVSRQKEIYVMAANYLQSLDWRNNPEIMKNIINFYTKGRAMESLAGFYDVCAQVEVDEFQNYIKALGALKEGLKCLGKAKSKNPAALEAKVVFLTERIDVVQKFIEVKSLYKVDVERSIQQCQALLDEPNLDTSVRTGDVYGVLIEHFAHCGNFEQAYSLMEELRQRVPTVNMSHYVEIKTLEAIHNSLGIPLGRGIGADTVSGPQHVRESEDDDAESVDEAEDAY